MQYVKLGRTGLDVSRLCLGCMTFGVPERGTHPWTLDEEAGRSSAARSISGSISSTPPTPTPTAPARRSSGARCGISCGATMWSSRRKYSIACGRVPTAPGLSRKAIMFAIDDSLRRLGTDYVDLYQIHRWDYTTPIEETLEALHDVVKAGKARYIGASSMYAWQFCKALYVARERGWTSFVTMQDHYNLLHREEEREMLPLCAAEGIGVIPWSPLARGRLTRPWDESTERLRTDEVGKTLYTAAIDADRTVVERVVEIAAARGVKPAVVALAWVLHKPVVTAPIVGISKPHHLDDAVAALSVTLTPEEMAALEEPYVPHPVVGFE